MPYTLYIYDSIRCGGYLRYSDMRGRNAIAEVMERLDEIRACQNSNRKRGPSVVFERLALRLLQRFPFPQEASLWQNSDPLKTVQQLEDGVWTLEIAPERADEFLSVLLPLTRLLHLTVLDPQRSLLAQYEQLEEKGIIYPPSALAEYQRLDPEAATAKFTKANVRKHLLDSLKPRLAEHGFQYKTDKFYSIYFQREIDGVKQEICGRIEGNSPDDYKCELKIESRGFDCWISTDLTYLRWTVQPKWFNNEMAGRTTYIRNFEEVEWLAEDLLKHGLLILDKALTPEGVDWLYNSPEAASVFIYNCYGPRGWGNYQAIRIAIHVRNPDFEEIVRRVLEHYDKAPNKLHSDLAKKLIDEGRAQLQLPVAK